MIRRSVHLLTALLAAALLVAEGGASVAAEPRTRSFKLVKPPTLGVKRRITVTNTRTAIPPSRRSRRAAQHGWFWRDAGATMRAADPARFESLAGVAGARLGGRDRRALLETVSDRWREEIAAAARNANISEAFLLAVIAAESAGDPRAVSPAGAQGLGQLMPDTAKRFDVENPFEPAENLRGAADYLSTLLELFEEDGLLALAGYNAGENAVIRHKGVPPYAETRDYVPIVLGYFSEARSLCRVPPASPRALCEMEGAEAPAAPVPVSRPESPR
ncbi:MAG: lytic transglycosylase domain-containing protein [Pikeienuella sp.]